MDDTQATELRLAGNAAARDGDLKKAEALFTQVQPFTLWSSGPSSRAWTKLGPTRLGVLALGAKAGRQAAIGPHGCSPCCT